MTSLMQQIHTWATPLPLWEQLALKRVMGGGELSEADYAELLQCLLETHNLDPRTRDWPAVEFLRSSDANLVEGAGATKLVRMFDCQSINALVPDQTLSFGDGMTVLFGGNASGKSGYARLLACAGFTRGDAEVLCDVTRPASEVGTPFARIEVQTDKGTKVIAHKAGSPCPELSSLYVFDDTSVRSHLTAENAFSFSPSGLAYLTEMAKVTDRVRKELSQRIEAYSAPHSFAPLFEGESEVRDLIENLGPQTSTDKLQALATLSQEEEAEIARLEREIAQLKIEDVPSRIKNLGRTIGDLEALHKCLAKAKEGLADEVVEEVSRCIEACERTRVAAKTAGVDQFQCQHFTHTGDEVWKDFVQAAKALADAESTEQEPYPREGDICLLCHEPLTADARNLLDRLWKFLLEERQARVKQAEAALDRKAEALDCVHLDFFGPEAVCHRHVEDDDPELLQNVSEFVKACQNRRSELKRMIDSREVLALGELPELDIAGIGCSIQRLEEMRDDLSRKVVPDEIRTREQRQRLLKHRRTLREHLGKIGRYISNGRWAQRARKVGGSTRHITRKHNELFGSFVTDRYRQLFKEILAHLGLSLGVEIRTKGRKGETLRQIALTDDSGTLLETAVPEKILSGGEKHMVALADFLTEVALDPTSAGVVLDDPVTSLDCDWQEYVARRLAREGQLRQVIIFTHSLPFLYLLIKHCGEINVPFLAHWIKREDHRPGYVFENNCPALEQQYKSAERARDFYRRAKNAPPQEQETLLRLGFAALRTTYEAFVVFFLFGGVVLRFEERISIDRLKNVVVPKDIVLKVVDKVALLSRYIEAHLHPDASITKQPTPKTLLDEITAFEDLKKQHTALKKAS